MSPEREPQSERANTGRFWPLTALLCCLGLLCPLFVLLSLPLTFTETTYLDEGTSRMTGWQMLSEGVMLHGGMPEVVLFATLLLPIFPYLACLLLLPVQSRWKEVLLQISFYLCGLSNLIGVVLAFALTIPSRDLYNVSVTDAPAFIPLAAFLLSLLCSCLLFGPFWRRRSRRG